MVSFFGWPLASDPRAAGRPLDASLYNYIGICDYPVAVSSVSLLHCVGVSSGTRLGFSSGVGGLQRFARS